MFRKTATAAVFVAIALGGVSQAHAGDAHSPFFRQSDCRWGMFGTCAGADRDLLVDRLYRVSCSEAQDILEDRGFTRIRTVSCGGASYRFSARWKGKAYALKVSRSTGDILSMKRVN